MTTSTERLVQLAFVMAVAAAWLFATNTHAISPLLLPPLGAVLVQLAGLCGHGTLWPALRVTLFEICCSFALALVLGTVTGYAISCSRYTVRVFDPLLAALYAVPSILFFPLYLLFFGIGPGSKIALSTSIAFFPIVMSTIAAFGSIPVAYLASARSMGASRWLQFVHVLLPGSFRVMLNGIRLGLVVAVLSTLGGETLASFEGIGHQIVTFAENLDTATMYAWVLVAIVLALVFTTLASLLERPGAERAE